MNAVILQPSYVPWRGYFHQIQKADVFIFYDDVQYDDHGWRNRNRIKTLQGTQWLTIPVLSQGVHANHTLIRDVRVCWDRPWGRKHWTTLRHSYARAPYFARYEKLLAPFFERRTDLLADFTIELTIAIAGELGLGSRTFLRSSELGIGGSRTERLVRILEHVGAKHYVSGPSASSYIETDLFREAGITLEYMGYDYPEYPQLHPPYDPRVSILDLLFMQGPDAPRWIWGDPPPASDPRTG